MGTYEISMGSSWTSGGGAGEDWESRAGSGQRKIYGRGEGVRTTDVAGERALLNGRAGTVCGTDCATALHGSKLAPDGRRLPFPRRAGALEEDSSDDRDSCAYQCPSPTIERGRRVFLSPYGHALISDDSVPVKPVARPSVFLGFILGIWQHVEDTSRR